MNLCCVTQKELEKFQHRWLKVVASDYDGLEGGVIDAVRHMNAIPGIATVWCCAGHPERVTDTKGHVIVVCTEEGVGAVQEIYTDLLHESLLAEQPSAVYLQSTTLYRSTDMEIDRQVYPVYEIAFNPVIWPPEYIKISFPDCRRWLNAAVRRVLGKNLESMDIEYVRKFLSAEEVFQVAIDAGEEDWIKSLPQYVRVGGADAIRGWGIFLDNLEKHVKKYRTKGEDKEQ